jgi:hypothetical protein
MINQVDNVEIDWSRLSVLVNEDKPNSGVKWGFTLGPYINSQNIEIGDDIYKHESGHTMQSRILGPFYLNRVGISSLMSFQFGSDGHHDESWYEVWASRLGGVQNAPLTYRERGKTAFWYWSLVSILPFFPN